MAWTNKQQSVIDSRGENLLVSAAAGSGKTAVMVERIIQIVSDEANPVDIDRLLVVTFTNAAAAEMKERIMNALEKKVEEQPGNEHLMRQIARVQKAQITTIHSFCLNLIREHFMEIDLDPGFRIGEEGEISLLEQDAITEVLEEAYEKKDEDFLTFLESYWSGKSDKRIEELILQAYTFARSGKNPKQWLEQAQQMFSYDIDTLLSQEWAQYLNCDIVYDVEEILENYETLYEIAKSDGIPDGHKKAIEEEYERVQLFRDASKLNDYIYAASSWSKTAVRGRAGKQHDKELVKQLMELRKDTHEMIEKLIDKKLPKSMKDIETQMKQCQKPMEAFTGLVLRFMEVIVAKKKEKNLVDFSDLEQFALEILMAGYDKDGNPIPSKTAMEQKEFFAEIYVDEYQDTNEIQEEIIGLISGDSIGKHNLFMVGDLKQSIYGFRQAKPELFINRYYRYQEPSKEHKLIELQNNFRSRKEVLNLTNYLFYKMMMKELGGIAYDEKVSLFPTAQFPMEGIDAAAEIHLLNKDDGDLELTDIEAEAAMIGYRIREMVAGEHPQMVTYTDEDGSQGLRKAEYKDIVILLRTVSGWGETIQEQLNKMGIPAFCESRKGSFTSVEVQTVMSTLKVFDNEQQDIPFAAFLRAPFIGLSGEEMVIMKSVKKLEDGQSCPLSEHMEACLQAGIEGFEGKPFENEQYEELLKKLQKAKHILETFRTKKSYLSIPDLIWELLEATGYYDLAGAMPSGDRRQANIRMLIQKAKTFEQGSYKGLFRFVRYMEQLREYDIDYGEANVQGEHENLVRIMSIHKSKGLEYPIVFVSGLSKQFNMMDTHSSILMHSDYYFGPDAINLETREKRPTLLKQVISLKLQEEILGEELRILYVAMTRAKEKLIMTGTVKKFADTLDRNINCLVEGTCSYFGMKNAKCYLDWILMALSRHPSMQPVYESYFPKRQIDYEKVDAAELKIRICSVLELAGLEAETFVENAQKKARLYKELSEYENQEAVYQIREQFDWEYPHQKECGYKIKYSVSELKQKSQQAFDQEEEFHSSTEAEPEAIVPDFLRKQVKVSGTSRGTAVHKCMELLDFTKDYSEENLKEEIHQWILQGKIDEDCEGLIPIRQIIWFLRSRVGKRIQKAAKQNKVYKEKQFVIGLPLSWLEEESESAELAVVQGIIDLYFVEENEIVLVDYKTDRVKKGQEDVLIGHYQAQLESYRQALEQMTGLKVKEIYITSLTLRKNIAL